jgi:hypothetical protein
VVRGALTARQIDALVRDTIIPPSSSALTLSENKF